MLSRFHLIPERYGRTDRRTDLLYQYCRVSMLTRDKNCAQGIGLLELATDSHEASHSLSATAEFFLPQKFFCVFYIFVVYLVIVVFVFFIADIYNVFCS